MTNPSGADVPGDSDQPDRRRLPATAFRSRRSALSGAQRETNSHLPLTGDAAGQQQIGEVDATDQQNRGDGGGEHGNSLAGATENLIAKTRQFKTPVPV